ncbi:hypothetical protein EQW78_02905 [Oerskovia turbata]|uniref:Uncharacterized protein n=1 Tax=Oerskovia turbata TaxID=1713 RepID=A0A4Q1L0Z4_9CELL|nr:hypothetical protein EQW73_05520 [Oerskovia turbata]RXR36295.1 hypothetical protein EQW78_02905 [Oerskovia turbata]TGJ94710.1 hypothetical protein DLJ96_18290 [Actinotalea fermentans ATCC 43279 = JCM 9966 = DSM 3133]
MSTAPHPGSALPSLADQAQRLVALGVHELAGLSVDQVRDAVGHVAHGAPDGGLLAVHPHLAPPSVLAPLLRLGDKEGFVVVDMDDVDRFEPLDGLTLPDGPLYVVTDVDRGDDLANWSPDEALPEITRRDRTPLLLSEGIHWALQAPGVVERNHCYMTIGSRLRKAKGRLDSRTPAVWISNGTGRDGKERRGAPKVGWCWAGNRHAWLGFASGARRVGTPTG